MLKEKTRDYTLDVLKIVATLIIVFHHYQQTYNVRFTNLNFFGGRFNFGWVVELFFVISGVLMYRYISLIEEDGLTFPQFMKKRYFRLMPLVAMGAIVYEILICLYPLLYSQLWAGDRKLNLWGTLLTCLGIQAGWASENPCINNPTWYVSVLILCYVIFYFVSYVSRGGWIKSEYCHVIMILIGLAIATYSINLPFLNEYSMRGYVSFFFGVLFGKWLYKSEIHLRLWIASIAVLVVMTFVIINKPELVGRCMLTFVYYPALIIFVRYSSIEKLFAYKWIGTLGKISFDVYVWHNCLYILLYILMAIFHWKLNLSSVITMILFGVVAFLVGTLSHFTLEKYLNNIVKRYIK